MLRRLSMLILSLCVASMAMAAPRTVGWNTAVSIGAGGSHILGNPAAEVKVTQYVSYSCSFCADFALESEAPLRIGYISSGKVSFEVRHFLLNPMDLTIAMLVECGSKERFFLNHMAFLRTQPRWRDRQRMMSSSQMARWSQGTLAQRNRAIASDFQFYAFMEGRGYDRMTVDRCLTDQAAAQRIQAQSDAAKAEGIVAVPTFAINGAILPETANWATLRPQIDKAF